MIETLIVAISLAGIVLLITLARLIYLASKEMELKKYRSKNAGLVDLLNYAAIIDDGVVVGKDGSLLAAWQYEGEDNASSTKEQRDAISFHINQALVRLGSGWMIHVDSVRRPASTYPSENLSYFPDEITKAIDNERRDIFENLGVMYESYFVLTITWLPPLLVERKFVELMFEDEDQVKGKNDKTKELLKQFQTECLNLESKLSSVLKLKRLKLEKRVNEDGKEVVFDKLLEYLQFTITGDSYPIALPNNPVYLDVLLGGRELWTGVIPRLGDKYLQVIAIDGFPLESTPGILSELSEITCSYRWSTRFIFMDEYEAVKHLEKYRKKWRQKIRGFIDQAFNLNSSHVDHDAAAMVSDAEQAISEVKSGLVAQGYYTSVIVLMDENRDKLEEGSRRISKKISQLGFSARVETLNTMEAFIGSLPSHGVQNVRRPLINTLNLSDLLPTSTIWTGEEHAPCPMYPPNSPALMYCITRGATPFRLNLHVRDVGHTFMFGPTGAGKSTHLAMLAAQLRRYKDMSIFVFDKGLSMYPLVSAINSVTNGKSGKHFTIASDEEELCFCPLSFISKKGDRAWAVDWIDTILKLNNLDSSASQRNEIARAILNMSQNGAQTLSEFSLTVQDEQLRETIYQYTVDGTMKNLLDADEDSLALSDFTVFEIEELMNLGEKYALPVLLYIFRRIECALKGQPAAIILDEAWLMLGHSAFREKIREWLKVMRKANCMVIMATQSISDATKSDIFDVIIESTATKIFLPNVHACDEEIAIYYKRMGLNNRQIQLIANAQYKKDYYYVSEKGIRMYELALSPLELAFTGVTSKESISQIKKLKKQYGKDWVSHWLILNGINNDSYRDAA
jgi:type IV secretion system protein TrbE